MRQMLEDAARAAKLALGWACYRIVLMLPIKMSSPLYCWALSWAGYYAHDPTRAAASIGEKMRQEDALRQLSKLSDEMGEEL